MEQQTNAKALLLIMKKFEECKIKNPRFSQRAFASRLGLSSGALSEVLKGKRVLSLQLKRKIASSLQLSPQEQQDFFAENLPDHLKVHRLEYHQLTSDEFHLISDWWNYTILNLIETKDFVANVEWIASRLGLSRTVVKESWERLLRLGQIKKQGRTFVRTKPRLESSDEIISLSVKKSHIEDRKLIEDSILNNPIELRDHTSMTFVTSKKKLERAKQLIREFQDKFSEEIEVQKGEEVYKLSMSLFPLTKISK